MPIREQSRSGNCLSRLPFCGRRRPRCFASAVTTHRVESSSARSAPLPSIAIPVPSEALLRRAQGIGATRSAVAVEGFTFRSESEGMRWDLADAVTGQGRVSPVNPKERKHATPLFGGARFGARRIGTLRV